VRQALAASRESLEMVRAEDLHIAAPRARLRAAPMASFTTARPNSCAAG
jgi:hypothetical protein